MNTQPLREKLQQALDNLNYIDIHSDEAELSRINFRTETNERQKAFHEWAFNYHAGKKLRAEAAHAKLMKDLIDMVKPNNPRESNAVVIGDLTVDENGLVTPKR